MEIIKDEINKIKNSIEKMEDSDDKQFLLKKTERLEFTINNKELFELANMADIFRSIEIMKKYLKIE